ncbi:MAG TPA: phosphotransferase [Solirubrobacterales bacterium]|jgi:aminoglycoside phosphotransferase
MNGEPHPPRAIWPELRDWTPSGMHDAVFRAADASGEHVYVRADDGSAPVLRRLADEPDLPAPRLLDERDGWLLLSELPGAPLHDRRWLARPEDAIEIISAALRALGRNGISHGDMCLPNILGDLVSGELSGMVDWRYANRFDPEIDVASAIWSCGYNGYASEVPREVLRSLGWPRADAGEVERLSGIWLDLAGPPTDRPRSTP